MLTCLEPFYRQPNPQRYGLIEINTPQAREIVSAHPFEHQRPADWTHIGALAEMMARGEWREKSLLTFVETPERKDLVLVDGQHRLLAQGMLPDDAPPIAWLVRLFVDEDPRICYAYLDAHQRRRPPGVKGRALAFEGLSHAALTTCIAAAETVLLYDTTYRPHERMRGRVALPNQMTYVGEHLDIFQRVDKLLQQVDRPMLRRRLYSGRLQAVIVATVSAAGDNALGFWKRAIDAKGGALRHAVDLLHAPAPRRAPSSYKTRVLASAWNSYHTNDDRKRPMTIGPALFIRGTSLVIPAGK